MNAPSDTLLTCDNISVRYRVNRTKEFTAVRNASIHVSQGEIAGLVGESGSGKTTLGLVASGMISPSDGRVFFEGNRISLDSRAQMQKHRQNVQMIFQDPAGALNPRITIGEVLHEVLYVHRHALDLLEHADRNKRCMELLDAVGLSQKLAHRYPHALSGGQRQRVGIARALALKPKLLVADEPVSALDVSVQVQILNLLLDVSSQFGQACLFIAHDLAVVRYMCKRAYVMEAGAIVEAGSVEQLFGSPKHPYTQKLLEAVPDVEKGIRQRKLSQSETK